MSYLKMFAKVVALGTLVLWCMASSGAAQAPQQQPPATKTVAAKRPMAKKRAAVPHRARKSASAKAKPAEKPAKSKSSAKPEAPPAAASVPVAAVRPTELPELTHGRDPFAALIHASDPGGHSNLPPGIAGLQVATVQLQGMVKTADGMVAVVANPQDRVYFLHAGDHIYDGTVEKIGLDDITFRQESKDAFGRTVERDVSKRLYPIAGDAQ